MSETLLIFGLIILACLLASAFFSAAETSLTAVSRARLFQLVKDGNRRAMRVNHLRKEKESLIGALLLGNTAMNVAASTLATALAIEIFGAHADTEIALMAIALTLVTVVFSEILPKTYALQHVERVALAVAPLTALIVRLLSPITFTIQWFIRLLLRAFGVKGESASFVSAEDALRGTIELHHREGEMPRQDRDMLGSILDLRALEVRSVIVHRTHVDAICADQPADAIVREVMAMLHSRIPLWEGNPDNITGILHVKDLIRALGAGGSQHNALTRDDIMGLAHKPWFIPDTTTLRDQLLAFRARRQHFALVVDEYGAWLGIVTLEDIIEEIVGDIDDEHDERATAGIQKAGPDTYYVAGDASIRDLNRQLEWSLPDENAATVSGLVIHEARVIPARGQHFDLHGFRFTVIDKNARQIKRLRIEKLPAPEGDGEV